MYLQIKKIKEQPNKFWNDLLITMIGLYEDDWKRIKRVKLDNELINKLKEWKIVLPNKLL